MFRDKKSPPNIQPNLITIYFRGEPCASFNAMRHRRFAISFLEKCEKLCYDFFMEESDLRFSRAYSIYGKQNMSRLAQSRVAIFGLGGVGGYVLEALARSGIGNFDVIDSDRISISNFNRQILATSQTLGEFKTDAARQRVLSINPNATVNAHAVFFLPEHSCEFDFKKYDYVVDAVDTVSAKIHLVSQAQAAGTKIISCMGTGNKIDPSLLKVADIYKTSVCPLARVMRHELKKRGIKKLKVVFSTETPLAHVEAAQDENARATVASTAFVPSVAGILIASEVVRDLLKKT